MSVVMVIDVDDRVQAAMAPLYNHQRVQISRCLHYPFKFNLIE